MISAVIAPLGASILSFCWLTLTEIFFECNSLSISNIFIFEIHSFWIDAYDRQYYLIMVQANTTDKKVVT
jgi:hypothetical protein